MPAAKTTTPRSQTKKSSSAQQVPLSDVAQVAYELYLERGREDGHDLEDWLRAEEIVRERQRSSSRRSS